MQSSSTLPFNRRIPTLDGARSRGIYVQFYDPDGRRYGIPTYPYHWAPKHLYTARQLRARGLRPGGQSPTAQILWRRGTARRLPLPRRPRPAQTAGHPRPAHRPRPRPWPPGAPAPPAAPKSPTASPARSANATTAPEGEPLMNTPARHLRPVHCPWQASDPVLAALRAARARRDQADRDIRILLAYARELATPRPYRLADLADATGKSISGIRTAYTTADVDAARRIVHDISRRSRRR